MSYGLNKIVGSPLTPGILGDLLSVEMPLTFSDASSLVFSIVCTAVSAGVNVGNPVVVQLEQTWDQGASWEAVATVGSNITAAGTYKYYIDSAVLRVSNLARLRVLPPVGETMSYGGFYRTNSSEMEGTLTRGLQVTLPPMVETAQNIQYGAGGVYVDTPITRDTTVAGNNRPVPSILLDTTGAYVDLATGLASLATKLDTLITQTDGLEVSLGDVVLDADAINLNTDGLETLIAATNTKLDTVIAKDFATETTLAAMKTAVDSINAGIPDALGRNAAAASTGVVLSTEDKAVLDDIAGHTTPAHDRIQDPVLIAGTSIAATGGARFLAVTLSAAVRRIRVSDTTGLFIGIYDAAAAGTLLHIINPGFDGYIDQYFLSGATLYLISMTADAGTSGSYVSMNFLG